MNRPILTNQELEYIKNSLLARRIYKGKELPLEAVVWEEWMEGFLQKIEGQL